MARALDLERSQGMDAFRGVAVMGMIVVHTTRVALAEAGESGFRTWASLFEPAVSAAFLWLVGWSLARAHARASQSGTQWRRWYERALVRAGMLYGLGVLLFVLQYGVEAPDVWASPDVLATIAWAIVFAGMLLPLGPRGLIGGTVGALVLTLVCEVLAVHVSGVNAGPGAALPLVAIACVGACHGLTSADRGTSGLLWVALGLSAGAFALALPGELLDQHPARSTRYGTLWFWNHTVKGILLYGGGVAIGAAAFAHSRCSTPWVMPLRLLGRHALVTYVGHLFALGVVDRWLGLPPGWSTLVSVALGLAVAFVVVAMVLESELGGRIPRAVRRHLGVRI